MGNTTSINHYLVKVIEGLAKDAESKGQKFPINKMRTEADEIGGKLIGPHYVQYLFYGRGPGGFPPPQAMTDWVEKNPDVLERARQVYKYITAQGLGYLIGRKIAKEGTDIYQGKRPGIDLLGVMEENMPDLLRELIKNELVKIGTELHSAIETSKVNA